MHWTLVVVDNLLKKFIWCDSIPSGRNDNAIRRMQKIQIYFKWLIEKFHFPINIDEYTFIFDQEIDNQMNSVDCGVFVIKMISFFSLGLNMSEVKRQDIQNYRIQILTNLRDAILFTS
jgi:Ulp1 family protease